MEALLLVDIQNDFLPGGPLAVPEGERIIPIVNRVQRAFELVVATQDWHPPDHVSFASNHPGKEPGERIELEGYDEPQILWPDHCVAGTRGASLAPGLDTAEVTVRFKKGTHPNVDSYSAFFDNAYKRDTGVGDFLKSRNVRGVIICGLALDVCVKYTALDSRRLGFETTVVLDGTCGLSEPSAVDAREQMEQAGVRFVDSETLISQRSARHASRQGVGRDARGKLGSLTQHSP